MLSAAPQAVLANEKALDMTIERLQKSRDGLANYQPVL